MRVVLDTNVLLSAVFTRGLCEAVLDACLGTEGCTVVLSEHILSEFEEHAKGKFGAPATEVGDAVQFLRRHAEVVEPAAMPRGVCKDAEDLPVLGTVVAGKADVLVTGDAELQALGTVSGGAPILSPRAFYDRLG